MTGTIIIKSIKSKRVPIDNKEIYTYYGEIIDVDNSNLSRCVVFITAPDGKILSARDSKTNVIFKFSEAGKEEYINNIYVGQEFDVEITRGIILKNNE